MYTYVNDLPLIFFKNSLLCYWSLKSLECSSYKFLTNLVGLFLTLSWISKWIRNTNSRDNSIRTDCSGNRNNCTQMNYWDTVFFNTFNHRCTATCTGTSSADKKNCIYMLFNQFLTNLITEFGC